MWPSETKPIQKSLTKTPIQLDVSGMFSNRITFRRSINPSTGCVSTEANNQLSDSVSVPALVSDEDMFTSFRQEIGDKNLKIGHLNVNGLVSKIRKVHLILSEVSFDILGGISETQIGRAHV